MDNEKSYVNVIVGRSSLRARTLNMALRLFWRRPLREDVDIGALRRRYEAVDARHFPLDPSVQREAVDCDGVPAHWVKVRESRPDRILLYLHGGSFAFRFPNTHAAFAARLCRRLGAQALLPDYRLAPEHPFPAAPDDCHAVYRWLIASGRDPSQVVIAGDSAGGNLALVTLLRVRACGQPQPSCAVLLSPAVDCTLGSRSMFENERSDPVLRLSNMLVLRRNYVPSPQMYAHPEVSPMFADYAGLAPLFLQAGSTEMLRDEAIRVAAKAHAAGVEAKVELWPQTVHAFQVASFLPEAALAIEHISEFVAARTGWQVQVQMPVSSVTAGLRAAVQARFDRYPGAVARHPPQ